MIPLKLTISGIYSYRSKQEIDFRTLAANNMFGIFGAVGSGKSTILDAITYALYGRVDRLGQKERVNFNMMNLSSNTMEIDFEFMVGDKEYRSYVSTRRNGKNYDEVIKSYSTFSQKIDGKWVPIDLDENPDAIEQVVGLSYENFSKVIVIPQGKFREFLSMTSAKRTEMLAELFPELNKYDLSDKTSKLLFENTNAKTSIEGQLKGLENVTEENIEARKADLVQIETHLKDIKPNIEAGKKQKAEIEELKTDTAELSRNEREWEILQNEKNIKAAQEKELKQYTKCLQDFGKDIANRLTKKQQLEQTTHFLADKEMVYKQQETIVDRTKSAFEECAEKYKNREQYANKQTSLTKIHEYRNLEREIQKAKVELEKLNAELGTIDVDIQKIEVVQKNAEKEKNELTIIPADIVAGMQNWYLTNDNKNRELLKKTADLQEQRTEVDNLNKTLVSLCLRKDYLQGCNPTLKDMKSRICETIKKMEEAKEDNEQMLHKLEVQEKLHEYSSNLQEGEPCPLCGSVHHPNVISVTQKPEIDKLKDKRIKLKEDLKNITENGLYWVETESQRETTRNESIEKISNEIKKIENDITEHKELFEWESYGFSVSDANYKEKLEIEFNKQNRYNNLQNIILDLSRELEKKRSDKESRQLAKAKLERDKIAPTETELKLKYNEIGVELLESYKATSDKDILLEIKKLTTLLKEIEDKYEQLNEQCKAEQGKLDTLRGEKNTLEQQKVAQTKELSEIEHAILNKISGEGYTSIADVEQVLNKHLDTEAIQNEIDKFKELQVSIYVAIQKLKEKIGDKKYNSEEHAQIEIRLNELERKEKTLFTEKGAVEKEIADLTNKLKTKTDMEQQVEKLQLREDNLNVLLKLFKGKKFMEYVSTMYLENLVRSANERFKKMTRQQLELVLGEAQEFKIRDYLNAGNCRAINTLSGGQIFQASLSLALALVDNIHCFANDNKKFFFLDEGFGTQDKDSLAIVLETLRMLQKENRIVGVISHVEELKQNIPNFITVKRSEQEGSVIEC